MNTSPLLSLILATMFVAGCAHRETSKSLAEPRVQKVKAPPKQADEWKLRVNNPPKHAARVKVFIHDTSARQKMARIDILEESGAAQKPHKVIAMLTCEGAIHEEAVMTEAIVYRARMMGADAVVIQRPQGYQEGATLFYKNGIAFGGGGGARAVFRGQAIIYDLSGK